jgi:hypothetical protein
MPFRTYCETEFRLDIEDDQVLFSLRLTDAAFRFRAYIPRGFERKNMKQKKNKCYNRFEKVMGGY